MQHPILSNYCIPMYTFEMYNNSAIDINRYQESTGSKNQIKKIYLAN